MHESLEVFCSLCLDGRRGMMRGPVQWRRFALTKEGEIVKKILLSIFLFVFTAPLLSAQSADFSLTASTDSVGIVQPASGFIDDSSAKITVSSVNGFNGTVSLSVDGGGLIASLSSVSVAAFPGGSPSVTLTVQVSSSTPPGTYLVTVTGVSGTLSHNVQISYNVFDHGGDCGQPICPE